MFDFSIWEIFVILLVALIAFGPEQLPTVARNIGRWVGYLRNLMQGLSSDLEYSSQLQDKKSEKKPDEIVTSLSSEPHE